ncbi:MAG: 23S rRNA (pseudouridine(1915)-N(3))-methyltransferase RlmH, partial [Candidatus Shapirobacteria bacterium]
GIEIIELPEGHGGSEKPDEAKTKRIEAESLMKGIQKDVHLVALDQRGVTITSEKFSEKLSNWSTNASQVVFVIGGSWGLDEGILSKADTILSFGAMTFPHGLARVMLVEQIYRAKMIERGSEYHK